MTIQSHSEISFQCNFNEEAARVGETIKAEDRRKNEGWFEKYAPEHLSGIDIGCGQDPLNSAFVKHDLCYGNSDATYVSEYQHDAFHTVYASHVLEHLEYYTTAIQNWYRICKPGGHLIICVPHRDLYEQTDNLPSRWSGNHKRFFLPFKSGGITLSLFQVILTAIPEAEIISMRVLDYGYSGYADKHPEGEYSIEAIVRK